MFRDRKMMAKEVGLRGGGGEGASASPSVESAKSPRTAVGISAAAADSAAAGAIDGGNRGETSEGKHVRDESPGGGRVEGGKCGVGAAKAASDPSDNEVSVPSVVMLGKGFRYLVGVIRYYPRG